MKKDVANGQIWCMIWQKEITPRKSEDNDMKLTEKQLQQDTGCK